MRQNDDLHLPIHQTTEELAIAMKHEINQMGYDAIAEGSTTIIRSKHADVLGMMSVREKRRKKGHKSNGWDKF